MMLKSMKRHSVAAVITIVAYQVLTGCEFAQALALVSTYIFSLLAIVQADIWMQERKEKRYGKYERGEGGSAGHKEDKVSAKAG